MKFVLDCSVTMSWCFEDETNSYTENALAVLQKGYIARVPPVWKLEVSNVLLLAERKKRINSLIANNFKNTLTVLPILTDFSAQDRIFDTIYELARELKLTSYDAAYLELALREKIPLATLDAKLIKCAQEIQVLQF